MKIPLSTAIVLLHASPVMLYQGHVCNASVDSKDPTFLIISFPASYPVDPDEELETLAFDTDHNPYPIIEGGQLTLTDNDGKDHAITLLQPLDKMDSSAIILSGIHEMMQSKTNKEKDLIRKLDAITLQLLPSLTDEQANLLTKIILPENY